MINLPGKWFFAVLILIAPLHGCDNPEPAPLPPVIQSFVKAHPELKLEFSKVEPAPDWAQGKRWRAKRKSGDTVILYEQAGVIVSIKRSDQSFLWDRDGRHKR